MCRFYLANGISHLIGHILVARKVVLGTTGHESTEVMTVHLCSGQETLEMARDGRISDGPSALALLLCANRIA